MFLCQVNILGLFFLGGLHQIYFAIDHNGSFCTGAQSSLMSRIVAAVHTYNCDHVQCVECLEKVLYEVKWSEYDSVEKTCKPEPNNKADMKQNHKVSSTLQQFRIYFATR